MFCDDKNGYLVLDVSDLEEIGIRLAHQYSLNNENRYKSMDLSQKDAFKGKYLIISLIPNSQMEINYFIYPGRESVYIGINTPSFFIESGKMYWAGKIGAKFKNKDTGEFISSYDPKYEEISEVLNFIINNHSDKLIVNSAKKKLNELNNLKISLKQRAKILNAINENDITKLNESFNEKFDINSKLDDGRTVLMLASLQGRKDIAFFVIEKGAIINQVDDYGNTALMYAVIGDNYINSEDIMKFLLSKGADLDITNNRGFSTLDISEKISGDNKISRILKREIKKKEKNKKKSK